MEPQRQAVGPGFSPALEVGVDSQPFEKVLPVLPGATGSVGGIVERNVSSHMAPPVQGWDRVQPGVARPAAEEIGGGGLVQGNQASTSS